MLKLLAPVDAVLFVAIVVFQLVAALVFLRAGLVKNYSRFTLAACFSAAQGLLLILIPIRFYLAAYSATSLIGSFLLAFAVIELYARVLGPKESLPDWVPRQLVIVVSLAALISTTLGFFLQARIGRPFIRTILTADAVTVALACFALWGLIIYARRIGITWMAWPARIGAGFVLWTSVNTFTSFALGLGSEHAAEIYRRIGQCAYLISLGWWSVMLRGKEPAYEITNKMVSQMFEQHHANLADLKNYEESLL